MFLRSTGGLELRRASSTGNLITGTFCGSRASDSSPFAGYTNRAQEPERFLRLARRQPSVSCYMRNNKLLVFVLYGIGLFSLFATGWSVFIAGGEQSSPEGAVSTSSTPFKPLPATSSPPLAEVPEALVVPLTTIDGKPVSLLRWIRGTTVVALWASWCEVCLRELNELAQAAAQMGPRATFIVVNRAEPIGTTKEAKEKIERAQKGGTGNLVFLLDPRDALFGSLQGRGMPLIVVLRDGKEVARFERFTDEEEIRAVVDAL
ncbi:MAG: hypothetical protein KatS3mg099_217 [Candidatus Parcubacteria bacterium]|nr:MAG: hypothetical protein KatS3mg099_217 [Candidatus Parcubacteria bacterium]